jgi:hypothetical protein
MNESLRTDQAHVAIVSGAQRCELWIDSATGTERNPMSNEAIQLKFMQNTEPIIGRERASRASEMVWSLEMHDLGELVALCE